MNSFEVRGGKKLSGEIIQQGAMNEDLQIISAVLLTHEKITFRKHPNKGEENLIREFQREKNY